MKLMRHKGRHIVVADLPADTGDLAFDSKVVILAHVAVDDTVKGAHRRGRPPAYPKTVPASEVELLDHSSVGAKTLTEAEKVFAQVAK